MVRPANSDLVLSAIPRAVLVSPSRNLARRESIDRSQPRIAPMDTEGKRRIRAMGGRKSFRRLAGIAAQVTLQLVEDAVDEPFGVGIGELLGQVDGLVD